MTVYNSTGRSNTPKILRLETSKHFQCLKVLNTPAMWRQKFESSTLISISSRSWYLVRSVKRNIKLIAITSRHTENEAYIVYIYISILPSFLSLFLSFFLPSLFAKSISMFNIWTTFSCLCYIGHQIFCDAIEARIPISPAKDILPQISVICYWCIYLFLMYTFQTRIYSTCV